STCKVFVLTCIAEAPRARATVVTQSVHRIVALGSRESNSSKARVRLARYCPQGRLPLGSAIVERNTYENASRHRRRKARGTFSRAPARARRYRLGDHRESQPHVCG